MYVFSLPVWIAIIALALVHRFVGHRLQRVLLLDASILIYASFSRWLLVPLAWVVLTTWVAIRARHYTDDKSMLRFARGAAGVLAFLPLVFWRVGTDLVDIGAQLGDRVGLTTDSWALSLGLPVGLAFYTLQAVDAMGGGQNGREAPSFTDHALTVSFFPTVVIGPVHRHEQLVPQLQARRAVGWHDVRVAAALVLFGMFHKVVAADNLLPIADRVFDAPGAAQGPDAVAGVVAFSVGIVADLMGFTLVVTGVARLFGVRLAPNVDRPWLAAGPIEFWDRFLSSVTDWFLRHVFLPSGGMGRGRGRTFIALVTTFVLAAFWLGGGVTTLVWAALWATAAALQLLSLERRSPSDRPGSIWLKRATVGLFVTYTWVWFRLDSVQGALDLHRALTRPNVSGFATGALGTIALFTTLLVAVEAAGRTIIRQLEDRPATEERSTLVGRGVVYASVITALVVFTTGDLHPSVLGLE